MDASGLLTADEFEALRDSISPQTALHTSALVCSEEAEPYDFGSPDTVIRSLLPVLMSVVERVADGLRSELLRSLRRDLEIVPGEPEIQLLPQFMATLSEPCSANLVRIRGLSGTAVLTIDRPLLFALVNTFFGGRSAVAVTPDTRDFTDTERRMIVRLRGLSFDALGEAWRDVAPEAACDLVREEHNPQFLVQHNSADVLVVCPLNVSLDEPAGLINLAFPFSMLEPLRDQVLAEIQNQCSSPDDHLAQRWRRAMAEARVHLRCPLAVTELPLGELLRLKAGDVLPVELPDHARLMVEGVSLFEGRYGVWKGSRAVKIESVRPGSGKVSTRSEREGATQQ
jgi:flagellar motor switch protein FliM